MLLIFNLDNELEDGWKSKMITILKFVRECTSILATQVDSPSRAAKIASEYGSGFEDLRVRSVCPSVFSVGRLDFGEPRRSR
jgi:hypothetical protein